MDILNFLYLKRAELIKAQVNDPATDLIVLGAEVPFTTRDDGYQVYAMTVDDFKTAVLPTLQEVLTTGRDSDANGSILIGTGTDLGSGQYVNAVGQSSVNGNTGDYISAIGIGAAQSNQGDYVCAVGANAAALNQGVNVVAIGDQASRLNTGTNIVSLGRRACRENTGDNVNAIGLFAAYQNTGDNVIALGTNAGIANPLSGMFIVSNSELPSYLDFTAASAAITPTGIAGNTYLYHDQTTNAIGAVRL